VSAGEMRHLLVRGQLRADGESCAWCEPDGDDLDHRLVAAAESGHYQLVLPSGYGVQLVVMTGFDPVQEAGLLEHGDELERRTRELIARERQPRRRHRIHWVLGLHQLARLCAGCEAEANALDEGGQ
jgi:hypothetical protein